jgi:hypothetical protein
MGNLIAQRMRDKHPRWGPNDDAFHFVDNLHFAGTTDSPARVF